jgi:hypothetical protein
VAALRDRSEEAAKAVRGARGEARQSGSARRIGGRAAAGGHRCSQGLTGRIRSLFEEFRAKRFKLLWRRSSDGFTAREFHRLCDGRASILTLVFDTDGNASDFRSQAGRSAVGWSRQQCATKSPPGDQILFNAELQTKTNDLLTAIGDDTTISLILD